MVQGPVNFQSHIGDRGITMKEIKNVRLGSILEQAPPPPPHRKIASGSVFYSFWEVGGPSAFSQHFNPHPPQRLDSKRILFPLNFFLLCSQMCIGLLFSPRG